MEPSEKRTEVVSTVRIRADTDDRAPLSSPKKIISIYAGSFLILATVIVGFIWHDLREDYRDTLAYWNVQLSSSADERVRVGALWLKERRTDTIAVAENPLTVRLLDAGGSASKVGEIQQGVEREIAHIAVVNGFLGGAVGDRGCRIAAQAGLRLEMAQGVQEACQWVQQTGEYRIDTFGMEQGRLWLNLTAPVMAEGRAAPSAPITRRIVGAVMMVSENWQDFILTFGPESAPTRTSETLVVWKNAGEAFVFSPRLSARGVPSFFRRPLKGSTFESHVARDGDVAFGEFIDYRGRRVFGVARRIAAGGDSVASKVDWEEALSAYHRHRVLDWLAGTLSLLLLGSVMVALQGHAAVRDSEQRVRQQEALWERERRYRVLFESAGDGIFLIRDGYCVDCNQKALELFGCGREQFIGHAPSDFSPPQQPNGRASQEAAREKVRLALEGQTLHFEWQHRRSDGTPFEAEVTLSRLEIAAEAHLIALVRDVTEHKRAEEALHESEERFRTIFENAGIGMTLVDMQGHSIKSNPALWQMMGCSEEELRGRRFTEFTHPDDQDLDWGLYGELAAGKRDKYEIEKRYLKKGGDVMWGRLIVSLIKGRHGRPLYAVGMVEDITERKRAEEALRQSERRYKDFISHSHEGVWRVELEKPIPIDLPSEQILEGLLQYGYMAECNLAHARNFGCSTPEEMVGMRLGDLIPPSDQGRFDSLRSEARSGWQDRTVEFRSRDKAGNQKHFVRTEIPIIENGMLLHVWGITRDITERKQAEEERQWSFGQLRALAGRLQSIREEEQKRVAREIHDQLGQALTAIKIDLSSLLRDSATGGKPPAERTSAMLKLVDESIHTVRRICTELRPGMLDDLGLVATIEWAGEDFQARTGTTCRLDLPRDDTAVGPERATAIFRIFQETLTNVARHAEASEVVVRLAKEDGNLTLEVHDNGKGIPADKLAHGESLGILGMR